ncbi:MAG: hypothetical protein WC389_11570 [Lutibacter sp.]|jgi:hypothetical protein
MIELPEIKRKARKLPFRKSEAVKELEQLAMVEARRLHPDIPDSVLCPRVFRDDRANNLTKCVVEYIRLKGGFASRINNQGTFNRKLNKYIPSTSRKGLADVMATFRGLSLHIEVKAGKDVQSDEQKKVESEVRHAGGYYFLAKDFESFYQWFNSLE